MELVLGAKEVVTINSTVGLEALICGKKVTVLGKSVYGSFSKRQAAVYAMRYLVEFDLYGTSPISKEAIDRVLSFVPSRQ
jgi:capsular polysaccharide export protein